MKRQRGAQPPKKVDVVTVEDSDDEIPPVKLDRRSQSPPDVEIIEDPYSQEDPSEQRVLHFGPVSDFESDEEEGEEGKQQEEEGQDGREGIPLKEMSNVLTNDYVIGKKVEGRTLVVLGGYANWIEQGKRRGATRIVHFDTTKKENITGNVFFLAGLYVEGNTGIMPSSSQDAANTWPCWPQLASDLSLSGDSVGPVAIMQFMMWKPTQGRDDEQQKLQLQQITWEKTEDQLRAKKNGEVLNLPFDIMVVSTEYEDLMNEVYSLSSVQAMNKSFNDI